MEFTLYSFWRSSASWRVRIILSIKGLNYSYIPINLLKQDNITKNYLSINPLGQLPTLVKDNYSLTQSLAIANYLEAKYPNPPITPKDPELLGKMWEICEIINSSIQPLQNIYVLEKIESLGGNKKEWAQMAIINGFNSIEKILEKTSETYSIGKSITLADACLVPQVGNAKRFEVDLFPYPNIKRISDTLSSIESFKKAHPDSQPDAVVNK